MSDLLLFSLDNRQYALPLPFVERVVRAAALTPLPKAPAIVLGILDLAGRVVPAVDPRRRFRLPERELRPSDQFIIAQSRSLTLALVVDGTLGVIPEPAPEETQADAIPPGTEYVAGVTRTADGLVLIHDLDSFLSLAEEAALADALAGEEQS